MQGPRFMYLFVLAVVFSLTSTAHASHRNGPQSQCRCYPSDVCWPSVHQFAAFNQSLGGRLIATVPLASPCHDDQFTPYNATECEILQEGWLEPQTQYSSSIAPSPLQGCLSASYDDSASIMAPYFANRSCDPFLLRADRCVVGTYNAYTVNVSDYRHVSQAIQFATNHNIRLTIRNTGHDYNGKSTGAGAIGIWTHNMKDIEIIDCDSQHYSGKAMKMGAGVQGFEAYEAADAHGLSVVGGECPTVGLAGGYTQGGGHSALASKYGLAADQVLEWEVIDGTGEYHKATRDENSDLFWALSGGGGGTYGVVMSMTSKAHEDIPVSGANLTFTSEGISQDVYYEAVSTYHATLPAIVDAGAMSVWYFTNTSFSISPLTGPGVTAAELKQLLTPFLNKLEQLGINNTLVFRQFPSYLEQFNAMQSALQVGILQLGGRLIPRSVVQNNNEALTSAYRYINEHGGQFIGIGVNVSRAVAGDVYNSVNPAWRETLIDTVITTPWNFTAPWKEMIADQRKMTDDFIPRLAALTPNGGCYANEGDFMQPNFENVFYGENYNRLLSIKDRYDPNQMFYATTAVGSARWAVQADGRLCKAL